MQRCEICSKLQKFWWKKCKTFEKRFVENRTNTKKTAQFGENRKKLSKIGKSSGCQKMLQINEDRCGNQKQVYYAARTSAHGKYKKRNKRREKNPCLWRLCKLRWCCGVGFDAAPGTIHLLQVFDRICYM